MRSLPMGRDLTVTFFYGFDLPEGHSYLQGKYWEDVYVAKKGLVDPHDGKDYFAWDQLKKSLRDACPVSITECGVGEPYAEYLYLKGTTTEACNGECAPVKLDLPPDADKLIREFCEFMEIPWQQPKWMITGVYI